ncbi:imidazole glycerol phosphate synthase subunit HisH [Oceanospirillaceae bacterium]|nr:imidazole glycerol phosphate synthase subunit HisH [Oceanospirillaceae bacterium]
MIGIIETKFCNRNAYRNVFNYLNLRYEFISEPKSVPKTIDRFLIPGVSSFEGIASSLKSSGLDDFLKQKHAYGNLIVGTCAGMQIFFKTSEESPKDEGLDLIKGSVKKFETTDGINLNVGWKSTESGEFYFAHSYYCSIAEGVDDIEYSTFKGQKFTASFRKNNLVGMQFHPEKSGEMGLNMIKRFITS